MSKLIEEWKPVKGYEGLYEVSDWGNVKSLNYNHTGKPRLLKKTLNVEGYHVVSLFNKEKNKSISYKVHILVAKAFISNPENKKEVGHTKTLENGLEDKTANEFWNLQWMTREENGNYGTIIERLSESKMGKKNPMYGKKRSEESKAKQKIKVNQYNKITGEFIKTWDSAADVENELKICHSDIAKVCKGKIKSAGGYKWNYTDELYN